MITLYCGGTGGSGAPYNTSISYDYGDVLALAGDVSGEEAGQWLREGGKVIAVKDPLDATRVYEMGSLKLSATEAAPGGASRTHYPSRAQTTWYTNAGCTAGPVTDPYNVYNQP